jgi:3-hydroxyisobutyrate dehydrogenase-like beta-hydroxyacid dehydrogenase
MQCQMQAGTTGINTVRLYNPVKQGLDHDPTGTYVRRWVPELAGVPLAHLHTPWTMAAAEQEAVHRYNLAALMLKDLKLAIAAATNAGASVPMGAQAAALYQLFANNGGGGQDFSAIVKLLRG